MPILDDEILPGKIYVTAFPMMEGEPKPLLIFAQCKESANCQYCNLGQDYCGRVITKVDFSGDIKGIVRMVTEFKIRYAMILSTSILNQKTSWRNVIVAPIVGIHDNELNDPKIKRIIQRDLSMFTTYYLEPDVTGMHCYVDLGKLSYIPKTWLIREQANLGHIVQLREDISIRLGLLLAQRKLQECENCKRPCEKCALKTEIEQLKERLKQVGT